MTPTGIEPVLPPWKGDVLTAWPRSPVWRFPLKPLRIHALPAASDSSAEQDSNSQQLG